MDVTDPMAYYSAMTIMMILNYRNSAIKIKTLYYVNIDINLDYYMIVCTYN